MLSLVDFLGRLEELVYDGGPCWETTLVELERVGRVPWEYEKRGHCARSLLEVGA